MKILEKLYPSWFKKSEYKEKTYRFSIKEKDLVIGELYAENENGKRMYFFKYSKEFENQHSKENAIRKLTGFNSFKEYRSKDLYPFFWSRIPDPNRPLIKEIVEEKKIDKNDPLQLLAYFGRKTLDNSFIVEEINDAQSVVERKKS